MTMATIERIYTIPLRRGTLLAPRTRRAKKAILVLRKFIAHHMKSEDISLSQTLNEHIWQNGMRNPILRVTVAVTKDDKNKVNVRLATEKLEIKVESKSDAKSEKSDKKTATPASAPVAPTKKVEAKPAAKAEPAKK